MASLILLIFITITLVIIIISAIRLKLTTTIVAGVALVFELIVSVYHLLISTMNL